VLIGEDDTAMERNRTQANLLTRTTNAALRVLLGRFGLNLQGAKLLHVRGRKSGKMYSVPVNPVLVGGSRYLFSPRGETAWVKNIRVSGEGSLQLGQWTEHVRVEEVPDSEKVPIIRAYLARWHWQVGKLVGVPKDADDAALRSIASKHPVFRILPERTSES